MEVYLSRKECADWFGCSIQTISNYIEKGLLTHRRVNDNVFVSKDSATEFLEKYAETIQADEEQINLYMESLKKKKLEAKADISAILLKAKMRTMLGTVLSLGHVFGNILNQKEVDILSEYICTDKSTADIAEKYNLTATRINQIVGKCVRKIEYAPSQINQLIKENNELAFRCAKQHVMIEELNKICRKRYSENSADKYLFRGYTKQQFEAVKIKIADCNFSIRTMNCLRSFGIVTLGDIVLKGKKNILKIRNLGKKSICEIEDMLESNNLKLQ